MKYQFTTLTLSTLLLSASAKALPNRGLRHYARDEPQVQTSSIYPAPSIIASSLDTTQYVPTETAIPTPSEECDHETGGMSSQLVVPTSVDTAIPPPPSLFSDPPQPIATTWAEQTPVTSLSYSIGSTAVDTPCSESTLPPHSSAWTDPGYGPPTSSWVETPLPSSLIGTPLPPPVVTSYTVPPEVVSSWVPSSVETPCSEETPGTSLLDVPVPTPIETSVEAPIETPCSCEQPGVPTSIVSSLWPTPSAGYGDGACLSDGAVTFTVTLTVSATAGESPAPTPVQTSVESSVQTSAISSFYSSVETSVLSSVYSSVQLPSPSVGENTLQTSVQSTIQTPVETPIATPTA